MFTIYMPLIKNWKKQNRFYIAVLKNQGKCHFMCLGRNTENGIFVFNNKIIKNSEETENSPDNY